MKEEGDQRVFVKLLFILAAITTVAFMLNLGTGIPLWRQMPLDFDIMLPGGTIHLPLGSCAAVSAIITLIAYAAERRSR